MLPRDQLIDTSGSSGPSRRRKSSSVRLGIVALALSLTVIAILDWPAFFSDIRPHGERKERASGRDFLRETDVRPRPEISSAAPGWNSERAWSGHDDWEPFVAADRFSSYVYQMVTRFNSAVSGIFIRRSTDGGSTWLPDQLVAPINVWQADPQVQVSDDGTVFAASARWPGLDI